MQKKENRGQPMVLTSGSIKKQLVFVASFIVVMRYKGNKWQSKAVVKMIQN